MILVLLKIKLTISLNIKIKSKIIFLGVRAGFLFQSFGPKTEGQKDFHVNP